MKKIFIPIILLLSGAVSAEAQDSVETTLGTDIVSHYVWRGQNLGGVSVQPTLGIGFKGLSLSAWGSVGLSNPLDTREFDLTLAYSAGGFNIGVTDYWFDSSLDPENRYFAYGSNGTNHVFEATAGYDFGFASLQWYTNFAGNDSMDESGKLAYSSYLEANVPFSIGDFDCELMSHRSIRGVFPAQVEKILRVEFEDVVLKLTTPLVVGVRACPSTFHTKLKSESWS